MQELEELGSNAITSIQDEWEDFREDDARRLGQAQGFLFDGAC